MIAPDELNSILDRIVKRQHTEIDVAILRQYLIGGQIVSQTGKYTVNLGQGQEIHIGDRTYQGVDAEAIQEIVRSIKEELKASTQFARSEEIPFQSSKHKQPSVDELVQQVRSRLHHDIQRLHGTMPLWGVDHWVSLGHLFVDVNILEALSSSRQSELDDLWQDFTTGIQGYSSYRSLERIGLGKEQQRVSGLAVLEKTEKEGKTIYPNLMVVGKPGSGKTTYVQRIVSECNAGRLQPHRIPVLIKLREFVDDGRKFEYNLEPYLVQGWQLSEAEIELVLRQGRALVLLDGLDEVTGEVGKKIVKEIKRFARVYPQVQMVVTCRTQIQESRFERFDYVEVADFNEAQVRAFVEHWFKTVCASVEQGEAKAQEFLNKLYLEENKPIRELAITPILLSLTCAVFHQTAKFYSKRSKLYEEGLELLLEKWDKSREIQRDEIYRDLSVERKLELLSYLAVKKFEQPQYVLFKQGELEGYIAEFLGIDLRDSRAVLRAIEAQHGLLIERAQGVWSFSHLTFQEYLIARTIVSNGHLSYQSLHQIFQHIYKQYWREVFLLVVEMLPYADVFLLLMKNAIDKSASQYRHLQDFLAWANQKANETVSPYQPASVRAFYIGLAMGIHVIDSAKPPWFEDWLLREISNLLQSLDKRIHIDFYYGSGTGYGIGHYKGSLEGSLAVDLHLCHARAHASLLGRAALLEDARRSEKIDDDEDIPLFDDTNFYEIDKALCEVLNSLIEEDIKIYIKDLDNQLPQGVYNDWDVYREWCRTKSNRWGEDLRMLIMKHQNIDFDWQFDNKKLAVIRAYCYANQLIIDCLNNSSLLIDWVRTDIEETLLLPIGEIEKRNCEGLVGKLMLELCSTIKNHLV